MKKLYIIKIGGSAITYKGRHPSIRKTLLDEIVEEISKVKGETIIIHGAGSYGHPIVEEHELHKGYRDETQLCALTETKLQLSTLNRAVVQCFNDHGIPSMNFPPSSLLLAREGRIVEANLAPMKKLLRLGVTPILHGDVVADLNLGFSVVSGDHLVSCLAEEFPVKLAIFGCDVDGVYEANPKTHRAARVVREITPSNYTKVLSFIEEPGIPDVTGGMAGKIREAVYLAELGVRSAIINITVPDNLTKLMRGEDFPHTEVHPPPP